jgi:methanogenic corrinoid protein MtbC1
MNFVGDTFECPDRQASFLALNSPKKLLTRWPLNIGEAKSEGLEQVVDNHLAPKLASLHQQWRVPHYSCEPDAQVIAEFARLVILPDGTQAANFFLGKRDGGMGMAALFETLLAPTARRLDKLWFEDECDFLDVTLGVTRLRSLLRTSVQVVNGPAAPGRSALLVTAPRERHFFGLEVVGAFLESSGWDTVVCLGRSMSDDAHAAESQWFSVLGVTVSDEAHLDGAARAIETVRRRSANPSISVMVGGWALRGRPDLAARIGADALAEDGAEALLLANRFYFDQFAVA